MSLARRFFYARKDVKHVDVEITGQSAEVAAVCRDLRHGGGKQRFVKGATHMKSRKQPELAATLKGAAMVEAIEAGLVPKSSGGDGWNIAPFLRFWDNFAPLLNEAVQSCGKKRR